MGLRRDCKYICHLRRFGHHNLLSATRIIHAQSKTLQFHRSMGKCWPILSIETIWTTSICQESLSLPTFLHAVIFREFAPRLTYYSSLYLINFLEVHLLPNHGVLNELRQKTGSNLSTPFIWSHDFHFPFSDSLLVSHFSPDRVNSPIVFSVILTALSYYHLSFHQFVEFFPFTKLYSILFFVLLSTNYHLLIFLFYFIVPIHVVWK